MPKEYDFVFNIPSMVVIAWGGKGAVAIRSICNILTQNKIKVLVVTKNNSPGDRSFIKKSRFVKTMETPNMTLGFLCSACSLHDEDFKQLTAQGRILLLSLGSPWIIQKDILDFLQGAAINLHNSNLPKFRGGSTISWQIMSGQKHMYSTLHFITEGIDEGDVIDQISREVNETTRFPMDWQNIFDAQNSNLLAQFFIRVFKGDTFRVKEQAPESATYIPRLYAPHHGWIDWNSEATEVMNFIRAFSYPYGGARSFLGEQIAIFKDADITDTMQIANSFGNGLVINSNKHEFVISGRGKGLVIKREHFYCEVNPRPGDRFHTPGSFLDRAKAGRAKFGDAGVSIVGSISNEDFVPLSNQDE